MKALTKILPWAERIFSAGLVIGATLLYANIDSTIIIVSLGGLAATFFLMGYVPVEIERDENEKSGFTELLASTILPKVMWISSSVSTLALLFYFLDSSLGIKQMAAIGGSTIGLCVVITLFLLVAGVKAIKAVAPILVRAVPLLFIDFYFLMQ